MAARARAGTSVDRGKGQQVEERAKDEDATFVADDEIGTSQLRDAPPVSEPTQLHGRRTERDRMDVESANAPYQP